MLTALLDEDLYFPDSSNIYAFNDSYHVNRNVDFVGPTKTKSTYVS